MPSLHARSIAPVAVLVVLAASGCAGDALDAWTDEDLVAEFERLHRPVLDLYAVSPDREGDLWSLLASSFEGEALTDEFVEQLVTVKGMQRDRTSVRVARVDYEAVQVLERSPGRARIEADWSVGGLVTHREHTHPRINRYRASYTLAPSRQSPGELRLVRAEIRSLERQGRLAGRGSESRSAAGSLGLGDLLTSGLAQELLEAKADRDVDAAENGEPVR